MRKIMQRLLACLTLLSVLCASMPLRAQDEPPAPKTALPPLSSPGDAPSPKTAPPLRSSSSRASNGEYVAPLAQETQQSYVPQSVALSGPRTIGDWKEGDPVPDGYRTATRVRRSAIIGGAVTFGVLYLLSALAAASAA